MLARPFFISGLPVSGETRVVVNPRYFRPAEVDRLVADSSKARRELGWKPRVDFQELVRMMVDADLESVGAEPR